MTVSYDGSAGESEALTSFTLAIRQRHTPTPTPGAPQQTATAAATETVQAQETVTAAITETATAAATETATAAATQTATAAVTETATVAATATATESATAAAQQTAAAQTAAAGQTAAAQTAAAAGQQAGQGPAATSSPTATAVPTSTPGQIVIVSSSSIQFAGPLPGGTPTPTTVISGTPPAGATAGPNAASNASGTISNTSGPPSTATPAGGTPAAKPGGSLVRTPKHTHPSSSELRVSVLPSLVQPGGTVRIAVSYLPGALVLAVVRFPGQHPQSLLNTADDQGHLALAFRVPGNVSLRHGRTVAQLLVRAISGPWHGLATLSPVVRPGSTERIALSSTAQTPVRALVTFPGMRTLSLFGMTDGHGHLKIAVGVPRSVTLRHGRAVAQVVVSALADRRHAQVTRTLTVSDMILSMVSSPIVSCRQTQTVHVAYHPNAPLRILLLFPHNRQIPLAARTDRRGNAAVNVQLDYVKAPNPLRIGVEAGDATAGARRMERLAVSVWLPRACRNPAT